MVINYYFLLLQPSLDVSHSTVFEASRKLKIFKISNVEPNDAHRHDKVLAFVSRRFSKVSINC